MSAAETLLAPADRTPAALLQVTAAADWLLHRSAAATDAERRERWARLGVAVDLAWRALRPDGRPDGFHPAAGDPPAEAMTPPADGDDFTGPQWTVEALRAELVAARAAVAQLRRLTSWLNEVFPGEVNPDDPTAVGIAIRLLERAFGAAAQAQCAMTHEEDL